MTSIFVKRKRSWIAICWLLQYCLLPVLFYVVHNIVYVVMAMHHFVISVFSCFSCPSPHTACFVSARHRFSLSQSKSPILTSFLSLSLCLMHKQTRTLALKHKHHRHDDLKTQTKEITSPHSVKNTGCHWQNIANTIYSPWLPHLQEHFAAIFHADLRMHEQSSNQQPAALSAFSDNE